MSVQSEKIPIQSGRFLGDNFNLMPGGIRKKYLLYEVFLFVVWLIVKSQMNCK